MLKIKKVKKYKIAKYPKGAYSRKNRGVRSAAVAKALAKSAVAVLLQACNSGDFGTGVTGPPPVMPSMMTENEARIVIEQVFKDNGVDLESDISLPGEQFGLDAGNLVIDGFNEEKRVGFEYVIGDDSSEFPEAVANAIDAAAKEDGPYVKVIDAVEYYDEVQGSFEAAHAELERIVQQFIDQLRAAGVL